MLKIHVFSTGYRIPVVYRTKDPAIPVFLPFTYSIIKIRDKAFATRRRHQATINELYQFFEEEKNIELDEVLIEGQFYALFDHLSEFFMIYLYRHLDKKHPSSAALLTKVSIVRDYLHWASARYVQQRVDSNNRAKIEENLELRLTAFFQSYISPSGFTRRNYKSLSQLEVTHLLEVVHPDSDHNPFAPEHRLRNFLIVKLFLATGIRLGELLLLRTTSMAQEDENFYMSIAPSLNPEDTRADLPDLKNSQSERIVAINEQLYILSDYYILHLRRPVRKGKTMNLTHGFLFTSELGKPLSKGAVADIFRKINSTLLILNKPSSIRISPHVLRHTFADNFLQYLIDVRHLDMARAKDELRAVCGWTIDSPMPLHYAARYISRMANQHNLDRIATTSIIYEQQTENNIK